MSFLYLVFAIAGLFIFPGLLILPGWLWARRKNPQSIWIMLLPFLGIGLWIALLAAGVGVASLANLAVELPIVLGTAVFAAYVKLFTFDSRISDTRADVTAIVLMVILVPVALRLCMPFLPE